MVDSQPERAKGNAVKQFTPFERFKANLELEAGINSDNATGNIAAQVANKVLEAEDLDAALDAQDSSLLSGKDMIDKEIIIHDFEVREGDPKYTEGSLGYYVVVDASDLETGAEIRFAVGATNVVTALWKIREFSALPFEGVIKARDTANGQLLSLKRVPKRVTRG